MKDKIFNLVIRDRQPTFIILERSVIDLTAEFEYPTPLRHFWSRASVIFREWARGVCFQIPALLGMTALLLTSSPASSMSSHPAGMVCDDAQPFTGAWSRVQCNFSTEPFLPPGQNMDFPAAYIIPNHMPEDYSTHVVVDLHGYTGAPQVCENDDGARANSLVIKNCAAHYPNHNNYARNGNVPMGWWGIFEGTNSNGFRISESIARAFEKYTHSIDWGRGITLQGTSYGGTGAILQSMLLPNEVARRFISVVHANVPHTMFVKKDPNPSDGVDERGHYYRDPAVQWAWDDFDTSKADFAVAAAKGRVDHIYYRINGGTNDSLGIVDLDFFRICDQHKIACFGTWHQAGHEIAEPGINLPFGALYNSPEQDVRADQVLPVFTESTANNWGERGHYNLGLSWNSADMEVSLGEAISVPIRYLRYTNIAPLPDQPVKASFNITLRNLRVTEWERGSTLTWSLGDQSGTTTVGLDLSATLEGVTLTSSTDYTQLIVVPSEASTAGVVYTRQPRARTQVGDSVILEAANWQHTTDVGRLNGGMVESDVVIDDLNGNLDVIHNCTTSDEVCVAQEARVSPDGTKIVYSVGYGNELTEIQKDGVKLGIYEIPGLTHARLWIYDLASSNSYPIPNHSDGVINRQPDWLDNDTIVFASNAGNTYPYKNQFPVHQEPGRCFNAPYCVSQEYGYGPAGRSMQIWTMNIDGTDARNLTPHENNALSPAVMTNGDILYSCWNAHGNQSHDASTSIGPSTSKNKWWLCRMDGNGADSSVVLNAHKTPYLKTKGWLTGTTGGEGSSQLRAIRSVAEIFKGKLAVSNYYRSNHVGSMGIIFGLDYNDPHVEGCSTAQCYSDGDNASTRTGSGRYVPSTLRAITPYGTDQDTDVRRDSRGRALGKAGYPAPLSGSEFLITHARGSCYEGTLAVDANRYWTGGEPTCQKAIYKVKVPMVTDPFDTSQMEMIAGGDEWQAFDARSMSTYQEIYGQPAPETPPPLDSESGCYLQVVDGRKAELSSARPYSWMTTLYEQCSTQGCAVNTENPEFHAQNMAALKVYLPEMWDMTYSGDNRDEYQNTLNNMGHKSISVLGSQALEEDGSVKMRVPCETPLLMVGTDANGMVIAHDEMLHSLREGESRTCHGCHDGHSEERAAQISESALERFMGTQAYATQPELPKAEPPIKFPDVQPILEQRCTGCHQDMNNADGLLYSRLTQDFEQIDWPWMNAKLGVRGDFQLSRPYTSKWVAKFARDSLLYWKCMGSRQDGRADGQYPDDIDFGPTHDRVATLEECRLLGNWIDTGIQN
jgi:hypothetical protein